MCGGPRDSEIYVCPKCKYAPVSFSMPTIMQNQFDDAYWLRVFAGQSLNGRISRGNDFRVDYAVDDAYRLLAEIKKREAEKKLHRGD